MNAIAFLSLVNTQARMKLKAEASRFYLSYLWWVLEPALFVATFYIVFNIIMVSHTEQFLLFLICGKIPFLWFSKSINAAANSIVQNKGLIGQVDIPKALFPYIAVQEALYKQWLVFVVLFAVVISYGFWPELNWFWLVPLIITQCVLILACAMAAALLVSFIPDIRLVINMGITFLLFCSGVFWDIKRISNVDIQELLLTVNPLLFLLEGYRAVLINRSVYDVSHLGWLAVLSTLSLLFMHLLMAKLDRRIAAQVLAT